MCCPPLQDRLHRLYLLELPLLLRWAVQVGCHELMRSIFPIGHHSQALCTLGQHTLGRHGSDWRSGAGRPGAHLPWPLRPLAPALSPLAHLC